MAEIEDMRENKDRTPTYYIVATDAALSGWGKAKNQKSYVAYPFYGDKDDHEVEKRLTAWMESRSDFKRIRTQMHLPKDGQTTIHNIPYSRLGYKDR